MSTSSSSPPSRRQIVRAGTNHLRSSPAFHQQHMCHPWRRRPQCCQVYTCRFSTACRWPATRRKSSGRKSTTVEVGRTVAPPSSATVRGIETSRVATSRETSTYMHLSPLAPREFSGGGGGAWHWPHTWVWWSGHPSFGLTCQRSMTVRSTLLSSCSSTSPPSSRQVRMRLSWPTTSL
jgi:hypothetical protein